jgi:hypothetical protein
MRLAAIGTALALVACGGGSGSDDDYPVRPGGGGTGGQTGGADARMIDGGGGEDVNGRVCVISDLRRWTSGCATDGVAGLTVAIGSASATTTDDGSFTITPPTEVVALVQISGAGVARSFNPYDPTLAELALVAPTDGAWDDVQQELGIASADGNGALLVELRVGADTIPGVTVDSDPAPGANANGEIYYDNAADPLAWDVDATDGDGKAIIADLPAGNVDLVETADVGTAAAAVTVQADAITFFRMAIER